MCFQVEKLVLIDASVYAEGTGKMSSFPRVLAYAGVGYLLKLVLFHGGVTYRVCHFVLKAIQSLAFQLPCYYLLDLRA